MSYRDGGYSSRSRSRSRSRSPRGEREYRPRTKEPDSAPKIFVGNLAPDTEESDFRSHFEQCGKIVEILMPRDTHTARSKGYGFVTYEDFETMFKAIDKLHGSRLLGNDLKVDRANERKERPKYTDDRRGGGGYNSSYDRGGSSYGRSTYDSRGNYGSSYDRGGYDSRDRGGYDSRDRGGSSYRSAGYDDRGGAGPGKKPVGYRCRITGLAREIGWQLLKDFLRQAGDVTYANVDPDGLGVGEYQTYAECRDAIDKLTGAALDGHIVKLTALNFDYETGERLDRQSTRSYDMASSRGNPYDLSSKDRSRTHGSGGSFVQRRDGGSYDRGNSYSNGRDAGGYSDRRNDNRSSGYDRDDRGHSSVVYSNAHNAPGGSSRYGGSSSWTPSSSKYGGSSRFGGANDDGYRGGGGPERSHTRSTSGDRHGPYDRPTSSR